MYEKNLTIRSVVSVNEQEKTLDLLFVAEQTPVGRFSILESLKSVLIATGKEVESTAHSSSQSSVSSVSMSLQNQYLGRIRDLSRCSAVHCLVASTWFFWTKTLPAIILGRFFGRKVIVQFSCCHLIDHIVRWRIIIRPVLRLADSYLVESRQSTYQLSSIGLSNIIRQLPFQINQGKAREVSSVQPRLLVISPLDRDHNPVCALRGYELVKQKYPRAELVIAGEGPIADSLRRVMAEKSLVGVSIVSSSSPEELGKLFDETDLFLHVASSSSSVGWLIEAISRGLPVVSSDEPDALELIHDQLNGLIFGLNNHVQMAEKIISLIESPAKVSSLSAQATLDAHQYTWASVRRRWLSLY